MKKGRFLLRLGAVAALLVTFSLTGMEAMGVVKQPVAGGEPRADIIMIDSLKAFGKLEEAPVAFFHDQHTDALKKQGKDCSACHETEKDRLSIKFKRLKDVDMGSVKETYHANCIGCHKEMKSQGQEAGPTDVSCRSCHSREVKASSNWKAISMDKSLHYRHIASESIPKGEQEANCAACHHKFDEQAKKLVPAPGEEGSCSYCHKEEATADVKSIRSASHIACLNCHVNVAAQKADTGPLTCQGCHSVDMQAKIKVAKDVPRLKRKQPDAVLLTVADAKALSVDNKGLMQPVAFNHKAHELANDNCRACHHESLTSCAAECHTVSGDKKGGFVKLEQAMHKPDAKSSCVGCHNERKAAKDCAGCHSQIPEGRTSEASCASCHAEGAKLEGTAQIKTMSKEDKAAMAAAMIEARKAPGIYDISKLPEKVVISDLVDRYEGAEFPHRKIVETMAAKVAKSELASAFHTSKGTFCQGCHHNSPASENPPRCASCHGKNFDAKSNARPGLKAAFHQQCIGCHTAMELEKPAATACADCHKERK